MHHPILDESDGSKIIFSSNTTFLFKVINNPPNYGDHPFVTAFPRQARSTSNWFEPVTSEHSLSVNDKSV